MRGEGGGGEGLVVTGTRPASLVIDCLHSSNIDPVYITELPGNVAQITLSIRHSELYFISMFPLTIKHNVY